MIPALQGNVVKRIHTFGGFPATRNLTVADIRAGKGRRKFVQTTAVDRIQAAAAEAAGIDHLSIVDHDLHEVRAGAPNTFTTAALMASDYETHEDILRAGIRAAAAGADAVYTLRSFKAVEMLADEGLAVQGHLGLVPRLSTRIGGLRAYGRTADEAITLAEDLRRLEDAGAYAVELECVADEAIAKLSPRTGLVTHSIGSGGAADVIFLFQEDACGDTIDPPRHARAFADMAGARAALEAERAKGLAAYRAAVMDGTYPDAATSVAMKPGEHEKLREALDKRRPFHS